jgi:uracil-DNA glycosylase family 4
MAGENGSALASALEWWRDAGVDCLVAEEPRDWLAPPAAKASAAGNTAPDVASAPAEALPATLEDFLAWRLGPQAPEADWLSPVLAPTGPAGKAMVLIDMPEAEDGATGILLSGAAGRLFDKMLAAIGESRESVHLASLAVARPLTGQIPADQVARLIDLARHYIGLVAPNRLLLMGQAAKRVLDTTDGSATGNSISAINPDLSSLDIVASYSPRFLMERPAAKADAWKDLLKFSRGTAQ